MVSIKPETLAAFCRRRPHDLDRVDHAVGNQVVTVLAGAGD